MTTNNVADIDERSRAVEAVKLRRSGLTYREIAVETGYWTDESGARHAVSRLLARQECEGVSELRAIECERLDALQRAVWDAAVGGDVDAVKAVLQVIDRRVRLLGLNAPQRLQVGPEVSDREFAERTAELIGELNPSSLREMFEQMPGGAAVLAAGRQKASSAGDSPPEPISTGSGETGTLAGGAVDEGWSNIGHQAPPPEPDDAPDTDGIPPEVVRAAKKAALQVIDGWKAAR